MLSKASLLILGIINDKSVNPYEMIRLLDEMQVKNWFNIANSTVYVTIKNLGKSEYVIGVPSKEGNMPEKMVYTITEKGEEELLKNLRKILSEFSYDTIPFTIASLFIHVFKKDEVLALLKTRRMLLDKYDEGIRHQLAYMNSCHIDSLFICIVKRNEELIQSEVRTTEYYISFIERMDDKK